MSLFKPLLSYSVRRHTFLLREGSQSCFAHFDTITSSVMADKHLGEMRKTDRLCLIKTLKLPVELSSYGRKYIPPRRSILFTSHSSSFSALRVHLIAIKGQSCVPRQVRKKKKVALLSKTLAEAQAKTNELKRQDRA